MDQKALRAKLLSVITTPPVKFAGAPPECEVYYRKPTIAQRAKMLEGILGEDGRPQLAKMGAAQAAAVVECACTADGAKIFDQSNITELENADADSWVGKLGDLLLKQVTGANEPGKGSGETASAS